MAGTSHAAGDTSDRYSRQVLFEEIGPAGQEKLARGRVTLIGCGALGSAIAETLVRAGLGYLRICDRDYLELNNLQRQMLFDEADVASNLPKAEAARLKLANINSQVAVDAVVADVNPTNVETVVGGADLVLDGTDNFETRYLINDVSVKHGLPWVYGAVIGATGLCLPILPGRPPCLRCLFESPPPPEMTPTCDTVGVLAPAVAVVAAFECVEAFKILTGQLDAVNRNLISVDVWSGRVVDVNVAGAAVQGDCPCCQKRQFDYLEGDAVATTTNLCGQEAVQINRAGGGRIDFAAIAARLQPVAAGPVVHNRFLLRAGVEDHELTLFADGRAIIKGTTDPDRARTLYARYVGI
jgi:molybdopterin/thiamine biosynthesis adenylyltransferase